MPVPADGGGLIGFVLRTIDALGEIGVGALILLESLVAALAPEDHEVERCRVEAMQGLCDELGIFITPSMPSLTRRTLTGGCR